MAWTTAQRDEPRDDCIPAMITSLPSNLSTYVILVCLLTCVKYLLVTSSPDQLYRSTDFDVHRNWLAVTRHLPLDQWYYDDAGGTTVHTLDYPPGFAYFEYVLSNNPITTYLLSRGWLDERCLALLGDDDNAPSDACVKFQRTTVLISDAVLYVGAWLAAHAVNPNNGQKAFVAAVLVCANPGLFLLDHIHFQYNAMLLGILLLSIWSLARGAAASALDSPKEVLKWDLLGAFFYSILLGMKHLFLLLGPLYFVYLLRHTCFVPTKTTKKRSPTFSLGRFTLLALVTGTTLILPYVPILLATESGLGTDQLLQIFRRLFPYQRGLVHSYWAANVWAVYVFADKCIRFVLGRLGLAPSIHLPDVPPSVCAILLLIGLLPAMQQCWKAATAMLLQGDMSSSRAASFFVTAAVYSSLTGFMLSYHCHEKAILTCIIPLTLLAVQSKQSAQLYLRISSIGHFSILPLLYRPAELGLKTFVYMFFMALSVCILKIATKDDLASMNAPRKLTNKWDRIGLLGLLMCYLFMELIHPIFLSSFERLAFLPLLLTSLSCALGLIACWPITFLHLKDAAMCDSERKKME